MFHTLCMHKCNIAIYLPLFITEIYLKYLLTILCYYRSSSSDELVSSCNDGCNCTSTIFEPVCGEDGLTYFSPCRAGCDKYYENGDTDVSHLVVENPIYPCMVAVCAGCFDKTIIVLYRDTWQPSFSSLCMVAF